MEIKGIILDRTITFTLEEFCRLCCVNHETVFEMVEEGVIEPQGTSRDNWQFHGYELRKMQIAIRLQRDLEVNLPGIVVILNLLEEIEELKQQQ